MRGKSKKLLVGLALQILFTSFQRAVDCSSCKCNEFTIDGPNETTLGKCITRSPTKGYYCYVNFNSECGDKAKSLRGKGLYLSYEACNCYDEFEGFEGVKVSG